MTDLTASTPPGTSSGQQSSSTTQQAAQAADTAKQAAGNVTQTAAANAKDVVGEARRQARDLVGEARDQVNGQVDVQHRNLVDNLHTLADELGRMSEASEQQGLASELVGQASERARGAAEFIGNRRPGDLVDEVRSFARRRPGTFLVGALVAGVAVGRLTRGVVAAHSDDDTGAHSTSNLTTSGYPDPSSEPTTQFYSAPPAHQGLPTAGEHSVYGAGPDEVTSGMPSSNVTPPGTYPRAPEPPYTGPGTVPA